MSTRLSALGSIAFRWLQRVGKALMLPVSVLPAAGLLLGIGSAQFGVIPAAVSGLMSQAGGAIFGNLPLIFAVSVALGLTAGEGAAALAAVVGFAVLVATMGVVAPQLGYAAESLRPVLGVTSIDTGVFGGLVIGTIVALLHQRFAQTKLPAALGFFSGSRLIPILATGAAIVTGIVLAVIWRPIGEAIGTFSHWASTERPALAFGLYGLVERALLPFGLHHIWNAPFFFEVGQYLDPVTGDLVRGEIPRFMAGDPTAGRLAGGYLFKMWGLPAAAAAIWLTARPAQRKTVGGIMLSAALTSFLTGITEPIEFAFLFVAPVLYALHAVLAGGAYVLAILLGIRHGTSFSHGLIDFLVLFPRSEHGAWLLLVGPLYAAVYFVLFRWAILRWDLATPGREREALAEGSAAAGAASPVATAPVAQELAMRVLAALGGAANLRSVDACITRLRVELVDPSRVDGPALQALGATAVLRVADGVQAVFGTRSEALKTQLLAALAGGRPDPSAVLAALGGHQNVEAVAVVALTRVRVVVRSAARVDAAALPGAGLRGVAVLPDRVVHLLVAPEAAAALAAALGAGSARGT